jgi:hypothetical protein
MIELQYGSTSRSSLALRHVYVALALFANYAAGLTDTAVLTYTAVPK